MSRAGIPNLHLASSSQAAQYATLSFDAADFTVTFYAGNLTSYDNSQGGTNATTAYAFGTGGSQELSYTTPAGLAVGSYAVEVAKRGESKLLKYEHIVRSLDAPAITLMAPGFGFSTEYTPISLKIVNHDIAASPTIKFEGAAYH